jgi:hypothetical protein
MLSGKYVGDPTIELTKLELLPNQGENGFIGSGPPRAPLPEPSGLALLAVGLAGLGMIRRKLQAK